MSWWWFKLRSLCVLFPFFRYNFVIFTLFSIDSSLMVVIWRHVWCQAADCFHHHHLATECSPARHGTLVTSSIRDSETLQRRRKLKAHKYVLSVCHFMSQCTTLAMAAGCLRSFDRLFCNKRFHRWYFLFCFCLARLSCFLFRNSDRCPFVLNWIELFGMVSKQLRIGFISFSSSP